MIKQKLIKLHWLLDSQFGLDPLRLIQSIRGLPGFFADWLRFRRSYSGSLNWMPCLHDRFAEGGTTKSEYFWQDLLVARMVYEAKPEKHVDIGSRVDGFVAHVASFRSLEVFDVRPISASIPGVVFKQADMMSGDNLPDHVGVGYCDSLSCLHALEHFGLGRYGDPIDPMGYVRGLSNMASLLRADGTLYLSVPIGRERVEFNANRVFDPEALIRLAESHALRLQKLIVVSARGDVEAAATLSKENIANLAEVDYNLGLFVFAKT
ncbi:MAG: hypothetical protein ACD_23C00565G0002 [uncultured bacterium]|nr:MAG: hypothetical protein ACD_23C00565G0002 [uncultured bacterium]